MAGRRDVVEAGNRDVLGDSQSRFHQRQHARSPRTALLITLRAHLQVLSQAIDDGVPVRAYHCWSLLDNFEWAEGYSQRFGLAYVDFARRQRRTLKASGHWYAAVAARNQVI